MIVSDKYISNLDITRSFLNLELNKPIFFSLYTGFVMALLCTCGLYGALTIRKKLCYCVWMNYIKSEICIMYISVYIYI